MRWFSECNATHLGVMSNTEDVCQRWGLSPVPKRIFESPDVPCHEFDSTLFTPTGAFKMATYQVMYHIQKV